MKTGSRIIVQMAEDVGKKWFTKTKNPTMPYLIGIDNDTVSFNHAVFGFLNIIIVDTTTAVIQ